MIPDIEIIRNKYGFYQVKEIPDKQFLEIFYSQKYYQSERGSYQKEYSDEEILYFNNKIAEKDYIINSLITLPLKQEYSLLDIGCGEGWIISFFKKKGWNVTGIDYSNFGCKQFNPDCIENLIIGDIGELNKIVGTKKFDVICLDNVLEHVVNPIETLQSCTKLLNKGGIIVIEVPNDFSIIQQHAISKNLIDNKFWIAFPDHISYFNKQGLINLAIEAGLSCKYTISDNPIDFNLLNENTNYIIDKSKGKSCHLARIRIDNLMHSISIEKTVDYFKALADLGLGRQIISFFSNF